ARTVLLEEGRLGFDRGHRALELGDRAEGALAHALGAARQTPGAQEVLVRVDAHAQRSVLGHGLGQSGAEQHALQSCRLRTSKVETRTPSRAATADAKSDRGVLSGAGVA